MIKIKVSSHGDWPIERQLPINYSRFDNYKFYVNEEVESCDYWFIFNFLNKEQEQTYCIKNNVYLIAPEPAHVQKYFRKYTSQFAKVITNQIELSHPKKIFSQTGAPWFINKNFSELLHINTIPKSKKISIVTSNKIFTKQHKQRFEFALAVKNHFKDKIDLFGRGVNSFNDKWDVLAPYETSIVIENGQYLDYFTEKITDSFLSLTYPFYFGCKNIETYFNGDSYSLIDINNLKKSIEEIERVISDEQFYDNHLDALRISKQQSLIDYNFFGLIVSTIESNPLDITLSKELIKLENDFNDIPTLIEKILYKGTRFFNNNFS